MKEPLWIMKDAVVAIHDRQLSEHGGGTGVRDMTLLESALAKPQNIFAYSDGQADLATLAASYADGIATNHPFIDGNKRSPLVVSRTFLLLNDADITATKEDKYLTFLGLAAGEVSEQELTVWFRKNIRQ
jgi:death-on-curing protein